MRYFKLTNKADPEDERKGFKCGRDFDVDDDYENDDDADCFCD